MRSSEWLILFLPLQRMTCYRPPRLNTDTKEMSRAFLCSSAKNKVELETKQKRRGRNGILSIHRTEYFGQFNSTSIGRTPFSNLLIKGKALTADRVEGKKEKIGEEKGQRVCKNLASFSLRDRILASF